LCEILYTYIKTVVKEPTQFGQNRIEMTAEKIILTIPCDDDNDDDDDDENNKM
jgi:hypothetical protein